MERFWFRLAPSLTLGLFAIEASGTLGELAPRKRADISDNGSLRCLSMQQTPAIASGPENHVWTFHELITASAKF